MGLTLGRAPLPQGCKRFLNLPRSCIYDLWESFNDIAEGFGLTIEEFQEILKSSLLDYLAITERTLNIDTEKVFRIYDDDENNLVDSLEFLSSFALLSGMTPEEKIKFIFAMYDFDESSVLTVDEMVLAFRSTLSGLTKLSEVEPPTEAEVEAIVVQGFESVRKAKLGDTAAEMGPGFDNYLGIDGDTFLSFCLNTPEVMSWIEYFDDLEEYEEDLLAHKALPRTKQSHLDRETLHDSIMNITDGGLGRLEYERKGPMKDFMPRKNWQNFIPFITPPRLPDMSREVPVHNFKLEWAYGYNGHSSRQNLYYTAKGHIVYPAGAVGVVLDVYNNSQTHFIGHRDLITCLKVCLLQTNVTLVASGESCPRPSILVWDCDSKVILSTIKGFHRNGVILVDFSPDTTKLVTLGRDTYHSIAVYDWASAERLWTSRTSPDPVYDLRFLATGLICSCGKDHILFWKEEVNNKIGGRANSYKRYRGLYGSATKPETLRSVIMIGKSIVTGSESGMLYLWEGRNVIQGIKGHTGSVFALYVVNPNDADRGLVSACTAGKIQIWNAKMEVGATFNATTLGPIEAAIVSVCWSVPSSKILIGFRSCEIFEMDSNDGRNVHNSSIVSSHFHPKVSSVDTHPLNPKQMCTVSSDKTVRIYDMESHKLVKMSLLDTMASCCCYSPDGELILIGLGSGVEGREERKEGGYVVLNEEDLTVVYEARDSKALISDCKYSPDGASIALASHDGSIYVYKSADYSAKTRCRGHTGKVTHLDFSQDSQFLMSNCSGGDLLFWDMNGQQQVPKTMRDVLWQTCTCVYSYVTQGLWGPFADGVECSSTCASHARDLVVSCDNYGRVRAYNYPCIREDSNFTVLYGHSAYAQCCRFSNDDVRLITTGSTDGCIMQWRITIPEAQQYEDLKKDETNYEQLQTELKFEGKALDRPQSVENVLNDLPIAQCLMEEGDIEVKDSSPWQRSIVAPSRVPLEDPSEPPDYLELEFVSGFTADRSREAIKYTRGKEIAFFTASLVVIMTQKDRKQRFYTDHSNTVSAIAIHPVEDFVASGQVGEVPCIRVWNSITLETICVLEGYHRRGIAHMSFTPNGKLLATIGLDRFHSLAIYDWRNRYIIVAAQSFSQKSLCCSWTPAGDMFVQCGKEVVRFWEIDGQNARFQDALLSGRAKLQSYLSIGWIGSNAVIGTADGSLYRFIGRQLDGVIQAHTGNVNSISSSNDGLCSGGADGSVKVWNRTLDCRMVIDSRNFNAAVPNVRCVDWDSENGHLMFGTIGSEVFEVGSADGENLHKGALLEGHSGDELWGLSIHPVKEYYCTVGDDCLLKVWDLLDHKVIHQVVLEMPARCCAYNPDGRNLAIGFGCPRRVGPRQYDGKWAVYDTEDYQVLHEARDSNKWITDIKYSPNGELLAMGSYDNKIYVYSVVAGYALNAVIGQHNAFITHIDFSEDSGWLQSNCAGFELCFFEADTGMFIPAASRLRDVRWDTQTCALGWAVQGLWPPQRDSTEITSVDCNLVRGSDNTVIACGDNYGRIQLYRYPATSSFAISRKYRVAACPITKVKFASGDSFLITIAGQDKTIMQWSHRRDRAPEIAWNVAERRSDYEEEEDDVIRPFGLSGGTEVLPVTTDKKVITTRPWVGSVVPPSYIPTVNNAVPTYSVERSHIFGLQSDITRASVRYNTQGDLIFPTSRYVCVYNKKKNAQSIYMRHSKEVCCIAVSSDGKLVASAERCKRPSIHIWDANTCETLIDLPLLHRKGVISILFSVDKKFLVSVGQDQDHSIALWESVSGTWNDGRLHAWAKGDVSPVLFCGFYSENGFALASGGRGHQKFWSVNGRCLNAHYPEHAPDHLLGTLLCGVAVEKVFVTGSTTGQLHIWRGRKLDRVIRAHEKGVTCIWSAAAGVVTAAKDGVIKLWSQRLEHIRSFSLDDADVPPIVGTVRSIDARMSAQQDSVICILAAAASGEVYEVAARSGSASIVHEAHYHGELWGLGMHPTDPDLFVTSGDDHTIRVWSISSRKMLRKALLDCTARCVSWSTDGKHIIVGMGGSWDGKRQRKDGAFVIIDANTLKPVFEGRDSRHWLQDVKFSPDGKSFAAGSMDHKIYIYNRENFRLKGTCSRHNSSINTFDFSEDSEYIQSDSADFEHLYFEAQDGEHFSSGSQLKDLRWSDWTCLFGWPVQGLWPSMEDVAQKGVPEPTCVHRSRGQGLLVSGDQHGHVQISNNPCIAKESKHLKFSAHVLEVSKTRFSCDDKYIVSIGKHDRAIIVWKVVKDEKIEVVLDGQSAVAAGDSKPQSTKTAPAMKSTALKSKK